jgi:hypothetical protein
MGDFFSNSSGRPGRETVTRAFNSIESTSVAEFFMERLALPTSKMFE